MGLKAELIKPIWQSIMHLSKHPSHWMFRQINEEYKVVYVYITTYPSI